MSNRFRKLQRGAADILAVAFGLTIISIAAVGTSYTLLVGRQALIHQEHYMTALFKLRGFMEEEMARLKFSSYYQGNLSWWGAENDIDDVRLDTRTDRDGRLRPTMAAIYRDPIERVDDPITNGPPDYWRITGHAEWTEEAVAGIWEGPDGQTTGPDKRITLTATFHLPR